MARTSPKQTDTSGPCPPGQLYVGASPTSRRNTHAVRLTQTASKAGRCTTTREVDDSLLTLRSRRAVVKTSRSETRSRADEAYIATAGCGDSSRTPPSVVTTSSVPTPALTSGSVAAPLLGEKDTFPNGLTCWSAEGRGEGIGVGLRANTEVQLIDRSERAELGAAALSWVQSGWSAAAEHRSRVPCHTLRNDLTICGCKRPYATVNDYRTSASART
jgi:hypothetical protein